MVNKLLERFGKAIVAVLFLSAIGGGIAYYYYQKNQDLFIETEIQRPPPLEIDFDGDEEQEEPPIINPIPYTEFSRESLEAAEAEGKLIILHFFSQTSPTSLKQDEILTRFCQNYEGPSIVAFKVDTRLHTWIMYHYEIKGPHHIVFLQNGDILEDLFGYQVEGELRVALDEVQTRDVAGEYSEEVPVQEVY